MSEPPRTPMSHLACAAIAPPDHQRATYPSRPDLNRT
jgi:hypothetical protein